MSEFLLVSCYGKVQRSMGHYVLCIRVAKCVFV